jgi:hypothetical protein
MLNAIDVFVKKIIHDMISCMASKDSPVSEISLYVYSYFYSKMYRNLA